MEYRKCGTSGLLLPAISLGLWHNFGSYDDPANATQMLSFAFENGITHFDLANNYGPESGSAEVTFGRILKTTLHGHRDEIIVSTKAGHRMWEGPYGDGGSRKSLMASVDQSLRRLQMDYVDIFYIHRYDRFTPLEETLQTLVDIVRSGKSLYVGLSKFPAREATIAYNYLRSQNVPCLAHQVRYNMFERAVEREVLPQAHEQGVGLIAFSPLAQGILTDKYLNGIPEHSRAANPHGFLKTEQIDESKIATVKALNQVSERKGMTVAQLALAWTLRNEGMTTAVIGASSVEQIRQNIDSNSYQKLNAEEIVEIEQILSGKWCDC